MSLPITRPNPTMPEYKLVTMNEVFCTGKQCPKRNGKISSKTDHVTNRDGFEVSDSDLVSVPSNSN